MVTNSKEVKHTLLPYNSTQRLYVFVITLRTGYDNKQASSGSQFVTIGLIHVVNLPQILAAYKVTTDLLFSPFSLL